MHRRNFLKTTVGGAVALAAAGLPRIDFAQATNSAGATKADAPATSAKIRGVNLGGWLVLEKWMVPDVYRQTDAEDEYNLCLTLGDEAKARLNHHRETFITAEDFRWIADHGLNAVRLPVGYWALEAPKPYVESAPFIDFALDQAQKNNLKLLLDLHGAPGSQNGWDHSGRSGPINWPKDPQNIAETLRVLESFAQKYGRHPALFGIELLNEPRDVVPLEILQQFYQDAYTRLRPHLDPSVAIVFHDSFRPLAWQKFMQEPAFSNVILDTHLYQCFDQAAKGRSAHEQLQFAIQRQTALDKMQSEELPTIVGEWSLSLPPHSLRGLSPFQVAAVKRGYADTQLLNYESTRGWFFWSYKLQSESEWNFKHCVARGWLPPNFAA
ncbi:MAG TPA: cellulase family glycosylhydrolase [Verrucomicrobiae bacterium]|jgi:glucan 1,3-beta-glucosidase|nr:cellulase family glycosylhydrolase [Verrucomicrobiae bacterium]